MSGLAPILELAGMWGMAEPNAVSAVELEAMTAVRWHHEEPAFESATLPQHTLVLLTAPARSYRHRGGRIEEAPVPRGSMGLIPMGSDGAWTFRDPVDVLHIYIPHSTLDSLAESLSLPPVQLDDALSIHDPVLKIFAAEILSGLNQPDLGRLYVETLGSAVAMRLIMQHSACRRIGRDMLRGGLPPQQLRRVCEYMSGHLDRDIGLSELAGITGISTFHFCRAFKRSAGLSPQAWLTNRRIDKAKELIAACPDLGLTEIALCVGYSSQSAFATAFRRVTGTTPSVWRRERLS